MITHPQTGSGVICIRLLLFLPIFNASKHGKSVCQAIQRLNYSYSQKVVREFPKAAPLGINFSFIITPMLMSRLVLNLRKTAEKSRTGGSMNTNAFNLSNIDFRAAVASTVQEFSGDLHAEEGEDPLETTDEEFQMDAIVLIDDGAA